MHNKYLNPDLQSIETRIAELSAEYVVVLDEIQSTCTHPRIGEYSGRWTTNAWAQWRVCYACGLSVSAEGCGFWAEDVLYVEDKEDLIKLESTERFYQLRRGITLTKREALEKNCIVQPTV